MTTRGRLICLEGPDGAGKSTAAAAIAAAIGADSTRQPGATPLGQVLREVLLDADLDIAPRAEALLMAADRAQHVEEWIRPRLDAGTHVVCDRYVGSSIAYQGFGRGLDPDEVAALSSFAVDEVDPDLVLLLDVDTAVSRSRMGARRDRIESAGVDFMERVRAGYVYLAERDPDRWVIIDAARSPSDVAAACLASIRERLGIEVDR